ncbi:hypothetical protein [Devosia salina]|uniref:Uncharacterized protein n=1 Tax=Devosia salina TaxID=2860336 RepID=A0ABX8WFW7_9HYPH|nr:hypothetical protein [Devosia salina]QYO77789.1 hypothetical protein K1X15_04260 [Devosia salina]
MAWLSKTERVRGYEEFIGQIRGDVEELRSGTLKIERFLVSGEPKAVDLDEEIASRERLILLLEGALEEALAAPH